MQAVVEVPRYTIKWKIFNHCLPKRQQ